MAKKGNINKTDLEHVLEQLTEQQLRAFVKKQLAENNDLKAAFTKDVSIRQPDCPSQTVCVTMGQRSLKALKKNHQVTTQIINMPHGENSCAYARWQSAVTSGIRNTF